MSVTALVDGVESSTIPVSDSAVLRGDGCFESIRSYDGRLFELGAHLDRMEVSARALGLVMPERARLEEWCRTVAATGDGVVRVLLTRGDAVGAAVPAERCIVLHVPVSRRATSVTLLPVEAPWHSAGRDWALAGTKTLSYAPNLASSRMAAIAGFDDALLIADDGTLLEGPTFSVAWVAGGVLETPALGLHILDSITRRIVLSLTHDLGIPVDEGRFHLDQLDHADEVVALSTVKEVMPVTAVGDRIYEPGPLARALQSAFERRIDAGLDLAGLG